MNTKTKEETVKVTAEIEFVAVAPWGWASSSAPATAIRKVLSTYADSRESIFKDRKEYEKDILLWMVGKDQWDRLNCFCPANKDGVQGILLFGHSKPEWQAESYALMDAAVSEWADTI